MFRTVPLPIIRSFSLYTQQNLYVWHIPLLCVQWKTPDDGQRSCPKHVEFYSQNKFEKLVHLVGFIIGIYYDARSPERQNLSTCVYPLWTRPCSVWGLQKLNVSQWFNNYNPMNLFCVDTRLTGRLIMGVMTNLPSATKDVSWATEDKVITEIIFLWRLCKEENNDCKQQKKKVLNRR